MFSVIMLLFLMKKKKFIEQEVSYIVKSNEFVQQS